MLRTLRMIGGVVLVLLGLAALFTPLTPGSWLALIGLELLGFGFIIPKKVRTMWKKSWIPGPPKQLPPKKEDKDPPVSS